MIHVVHGGYCVLYRYIGWHGTCTATATVARNYPAKADRQTDRQTDRDEGDNDQEQRES